MVNVGIVFFNNCLLVIFEDDFFVEVCIMDDYDIEIVGCYDFYGQFIYFMIVYLKIDFYIGEFFSLSYNVLFVFYLKYLVFDFNGKKKLEVLVILSEVVMMYDFVIMENFVVILDQQIVFCLKEMLIGGFLVVLDLKKILWFGVMLKYVISEVEFQWIEVLDCFFFYLYNVWEEGDEVVVIGLFMMLVDIIFKISEVLCVVFIEVCLNCIMGMLIKCEFVSFNLEVGKMNFNYVGVKM